MFFLYGPLRMNFYKKFGEPWSTTFMEWPRSVCSRENYQTEVIQYWYTQWSGVDKGHLKFVVSLPMNTAQGRPCSCSAASMARGQADIAHASFLCRSILRCCWLPFEMKDETAGNLTHTLLIQLYPGSFACLLLFHIGCCPIISTWLLCITSVV